MTLSEAAWSFIGLYALWIVGRVWRTARRERRLTEEARRRQDANRATDEP